MPNKDQIELNKEWVCQCLSDVTNTETQNSAWILVQEPGFIGFGVVYPKDICWPPCKESESEKESEWEPDWELVSDLRLFGEKGEWHVWRDWDRKHYARLQKLDDIKDALTEYHFLWGTKKVDSKTPSWIKVVEDRGAEIWLPLQGQVKDSENDSDLPLRLKIKQIVDYDSKYHLAGITDAALIGLTKSDESPLQPPSDMSAGS